MVEAVEWHQLRKNSVAVETVEQLKPLERNQLRNNSKVLDAKDIEDNIISISVSLPQLYNLRSHKIFTVCIVDDDDVDLT